MYWVCFLKVESIRRGGGDIEKWMNEKSKIVFHLNNFKNILLLHLKLEDDELYPALEKSKEEEIKEISQKYSEEMKLISKRTISFFETYAHLKVDELSQNEYFNLDLNTIIAIIEKRMNIEEESLYPLYDKIKK